MKCLVAIIGYQIQGGMGKVANVIETNNICTFNGKRLKDQYPTAEKRTVQVNTLYIKKMMTLTL